MPAKPAAAATKPVAAVAGLLAPMLALLAWAVASSLMILGHKIVMMDKGFRYPLTLTSGEQFASALAGVLLSSTGVLPMGPAPRPRVFLLRVLPGVISFAGTLYLGNFAYLSLSMAFIQMLKAMVPAITLVLCLFAGMERFSMPVLASVIAITLGTGLTAFFEVGTATFDRIGFVAFTASAVLESLRVILVQPFCFRTQKLMGELKYNAAEVLLYVGFPTGVLLAGCVLFTEGPEIMSHGWGIIVEHPGLFAFLALSSASVNLFSFLAIRFTSSLTFKTVGCMKNVFVVYLGVLMGDKVSGMQLFGYGIAILGFAYYTLVQHRSRQAQQATAARTKLAKKQ